MKTDEVKLVTDIDSKGEVRNWLSALVSRDDALIALKNIKKGKQYELTIKPVTKKRSLDANAMCWVLMDKLATHYGIGVAEVYRHNIRDIGGNSDIICLQDRAVDAFCRSWQKNGLGWQTEKVPSKIDGCTNVKIWYGSSTYDTAQMSRLIDAVVQECKVAGIEVMSEREKLLLLERWNE